MRCTIYHSDHPHLLLLILPRLSHFHSHFAIAAAAVDVVAASGYCWEGWGNQRIKVHLSRRACDQYFLLRLPPTFLPR